MTWFEKMIDRHPYRFIFAGPVLLVAFMLVATLVEVS
ncbi:hypothetical protein B597_012680 [Stutzerimonas stutzeri KOS6]|uniref:Uncharacterized protein n=1 Tax=Stutzerimonas stutzeri KOS6 TaxID=1218352 RepID=A0A061JQD3_STUST|nr:hypothetical protein B597_012680 [Stutzerimonas stutzeri KOS6]